MKSILRYLACICVTLAVFTSGYVIGKTSNMPARPACSGASEAECPVNYRSDSDQRVTRPQASLLT
ncbi:hypothetical protein [Undibacterium sp. WLX3042]|uniref:hypothetical protein n=1 Tax=Undibacterium sp. WLX3042 TaxID=3412686 RepID=UPI003C2AEC4C